MRVHHHGIDRQAHNACGATAALSDDYTQAFDAAQPDEGRSVVHVDLEAREIEWEFVPGQKTRAWAFGGQVPGPTIEAMVGDVLEIRLVNQLPEPTVVHWHGLRIPAAMDGTERVQRPIAPGESFTYRFRVPDAGTFWYHSHYNETVQVERWRVVNAASARYVRLSVGGQPFRIIGTGGGLIPSPVVATEVLLAPANRTEIVVGPFAEGETLRIESLPFNRGSFKSHRKRELFATLRVGAAAPSRSRLPERLREIEPLVTGPVTPNRQVRLGFTLGLKHGVEFDINREQHHHAEPVPVGELQVWDVVNRSPVHHPFHLHGFFFQVLEMNGRSPAYLSWEDTVNVPAFGRVRIAWVADDRPGEWMYHCHILEHHAAGMMAHFQVV